MMYQLSKGLPKEPIITDKEKEDILRYVETEVTEVRHINSFHPRYRSLCNVLSCLDVLCQGHKMLKGRNIRLAECQLSKMTDSQYELK